MGPLLALQRLAGNAAVVGLLAPPARAPSAPASGGAPPRPPDSQPAESEAPGSALTDLPAAAEQPLDADIASNPAAAQVLAATEQQASVIEASATEATTRISLAAESERARLGATFGAQLAAADASRKATTARVRADVAGHTQSVAAAGGRARTTIRGEAAAGSQRTRQQVQELAGAADAHAAAQANRARTGATDRIAAIGATNRSADPDVAAGQERIQDQVDRRAGSELSTSGARTADQVRARAADRQRQVYAPAVGQAGEQIQAGAAQAVQAIGQGQATATAALHQTAAMTERSAGEAHRAVTGALRARSAVAAGDLDNWTARGTRQVRATATRLAAGIRAQGQQLARVVGRLRGGAAQTAAGTAVEAIAQAGAGTVAAVTDTGGALVEAAVGLAGGHAQAATAVGPQIASGFAGVADAAHQAASKGVTAFTAFSAQAGAAAATELQQAPGRAAGGLASEHARGMAEVSGGVDRAAQAEASWAADAAGRAQAGVSDYADQAQRLGNEAEKASVQRLFGELINSMRSWLRDKLGDVLGGIVSGIILSLPAIAVAVALLFAGPVGWVVLAGLMIVGAALGIYGRFTEYAADHGGQGPGWGEGTALVLLGIADITGIPYIVEAAIGQRAFAPKPMSDFERWERGTQGVINLALMVVGGAKKLFGRAGEPVRAPVPGERGPAPVPGERGPAPVPGERGPTEPVPGERGPGETGPSPRPPMTKTRMIELIRQIESKDPFEFTAEHAEALRMNAELASGKWINLNDTSGRVPWDSIRNQLNLSRWRFLPRAPEAAQILRNALMRLPDVPERAEMLGLLDLWTGGGGAPVPVPVPAPPHDDESE